MNFGSGKETSIKELVEKLLELMNAKMELKWETEKLNGQPRRCVSIDKARKLIGFAPKTDLENGLKNTISWYESIFR